MKSAILLLASVATLTASLQAFISETFGQSNRGSASNKHWIVRYEKGFVGWRKHDWLAASFAPKSEEPHEQTGLVILPAEQVVSVDFSQKAVRDSDRIQGLRSGCSYARSMMPDSSQTLPEALLVRKIDPSLASRFSNEMMLKHPVRIIWQSSGAEQSITLNVSDCEYESFLANLRWMLGVRWSDVSRDK